MTELSQLPSQEEVLANQNFSKLSLSEIADCMIALLQDTSTLDAKRFEALKATFYKAKLRAEKAGDINAEQLLIQEARINDVCQQYQAIQRKRSEELAALQIQNGKAVEALLNELQSKLRETPNFPEIYEVFHHTAQAWGQLKPLTQQDESVLGKRFVELRDAFYQLDNFPEELRQKDYNNNLALKNPILEELRTLAQSDNILHALEVLRNEIVPRWRDIGPVQNDLMMTMQREYKNLSTDIFKRHQSYQEALKQGEEDIAEKKRAIISQIEAYTQEELDKVDGLVVKVLKLQKEFSNLGSAGRKQNGELLALYRNACNAFFAKRDTHRLLLQQNLEQYLGQYDSLILQAKEICQEGKGKNSISLIKSLQEQWKQLPKLPKKEAQAKWEEFRLPIDKFFEERKNARELETKRLAQNEASKRAIIEQTKALLSSSELSHDTLRQKVEELFQQWKQVGRTADKVSEELWATYKGLNDQIYARLREQNSTGRKPSPSKDNKQNKNALTEGAEGEQLEREFQCLKRELANYDNINFGNVQQGTSNPLIQAVVAKRQKLEQKLQQLQQQILQQKKQ